MTPSVLVLSENPPIILDARAVGLIGALAAMEPAEEEIDDDADADE